MEYTLTAKGEALVPLVEQMRSYGRDWLVNGNGHEHDSIPTPDAVGAVPAAGPQQAH